MSEASETKPRVLVVDDQPINIQAIYRCLAGEAQVFMATSGGQALQVAAQQRPELVLLDLELGDLHGFEVCARLLADQPGLPIVFVSAHDDEAQVAAGLQAGGLDFIAKPVQPALLRARVQTQLRLRRLELQLQQLQQADGLTGLSSRAGFEQRLAIERRLAQRSGRPLALLRLALAGLRAYTEANSPAAADALLRELAARLQAGMLRPADLAARWDGDGFACLLPETDADGARAVAERLLASCAGLALPLRIVGATELAQAEAALAAAGAGAMVWAGEGP